MIMAMVTRLSSAGDLSQFDAWIRSHPEGTIWQSLEWKKFQEALGRETRIYALTEGEQIIASALVVIDRTSFGLSTWDIPRGPIGASDMLFDFIVKDAKNEHCLCLFASPLTPLQAPGYPSTSLRAGKLQASSRHEQPQATRLIDLTQPEEAILQQMKPKGRYNISVAEKHGVHIERSTDAAALHRLLKQTGQRDKFAIHAEKHYKAFLEHLSGAFLLFATLPPNPEPIAALLGVVWGQKGIYYYGASSYAFRALMAPYALQQAAIRHCKELGCTTYDLLGIAPPDAPPDHPWLGVSSFKEKFGGAVITYPPEQQIVLRPMTNAMLKMKRKLLG